MEAIGGIIAFLLFIYGLIVTYRSSGLLALIFFFLPPIPVVVGALALFGIDVPKKLMQERDEIVEKQKDK